MSERGNGGSLPIHWEAENAVHAAEHQRTTEQGRKRLMEMFLRHGYTTAQARAEVDKHDARVSGLADVMMSAVTDTAPPAGGQPTPSPAAEEPPEVDHRPPQRHQDAATDREPALHMPVMPGSFSRALSSPGHWAKAVGLALGAATAVFVAVAGALHLLFDTVSFLAWPTAIPAGLLAVPAFLSVFSAASREVRDWVRIGGPKPIRWR